ncbi:MAG: fumarylacetoacetate hydrolase family protein [Pseudomonadota bacterium]
MADRAAMAAERLLTLRSSGETVTELPSDLQPRDVAEAYEVQDRMVALRDEPIAGWKIGATSAAIQELLGVSEPIAGPLYASTMFPSPAELKAADFRHYAIECEFAFRIGTSLAVGDGLYDQEAVSAAVDAVVPAIELISPVFESPLKGYFPSRIADGAMSAGIALGAATEVSGAPDLTASDVTLTVDGDETAKGNGALVLEDPRRALHWLANHLKLRGHTLTAGQMVSTGTMTGLTTLNRGQTAEGDFGEFGSVRVRFV